MAESLAHGTIKILGNVNRDLLLNSIVTDDALQKNFWIVAEVMLVTGFASTHLVKYSTMTIVKV
jgi:hypothetical protein